jgi:hypothetical protein
MNKRQIAGTVSDTTLPRVPIKLRGREYNLCFDLGALAEAESVINAELVKAKSPDRVNLLVSLSTLDLRNVRILFAAAVRTFHPELGFDEARDLLALGDIFRIVAAIESAWSASVAEPEPRPSEPEPEPEPEPVAVAS